MHGLIPVLLSIGAFCLGACPFSLWMGRWLLDKDIRNYGDGNAGAVNVFLAGGPRAGVPALLLDIGKGFPFVFLGRVVFHQDIPALVIIGAAAILGHAFSPLLKFRGGKAIAVTFGVLAAFPFPAMLLILAIFTLLAFLIIDDNAWTVIAGALCACIFSFITHRNFWETGLFLFVLALFTFKFIKELQSVPRPLRIVHWLQSRSR